jgi:uncharacterized protein
MLKSAKFSIQILFDCANNVLSKDSSMPTPSTPPIRTITLGIAEAHPLSGAVLERAKNILEYARTQYSAAGYEVQTVRLSTRPLFDDLAQASPATFIAYAKDLQHTLDDLGIEYCSLGTAQAARPDFPLNHLEWLVDVLAQRPSLSATVQIATQEYGLRYEAAQPVGLIIERLSQETEGGIGNFRFAMLACVPPGSPFFPAAYHTGPASLSLGLQNASVIMEALQVHAAELADGLDLRKVTRWVRDAVVARATPVVELGQRIAREMQLEFGGIDLSPAPMGDDSIVPALEMCGKGPLGGPGTLAAVAAVTAALKSTTLPTCGYCGLMLPVLEDAMLGQRWAEGCVNAHQLLLYSSVCGTGLDTIPLAGTNSAETIARLLLDVATLALRLQKPLSARLFPVPGKHAGDRTEFTSPHLTNTVIQL